MKNCPDCNKEYSEELELCPHCSSTSAKKADDWVILTTVSNDIEFGMVAGLLEMGEIPAVRKVRGIDGFVEILIGMPIAGIDVLVPNDKYEEALQLLNADFDEEEFNTDKE